ncbi:MAG: ATP-dependent helicase, partial [Gemmatimonadetes bacterium]|nr:ATP-dependent helicase [Gemmatimonadota bacterium]
MLKTGNLIETSADKQIREALGDLRSFSVIAGAGSGKTMSLVTALSHLREVKGQKLRRDGKRIACITYTNRAAEVIEERLDFDDLFLVSTLHSFLWREIKRFTPNLRAALEGHVIPLLIEKHQEDDNGKQSKKAIRARERVEALRQDLSNLDRVRSFEYADSPYSVYSEGRLSHDDVIAIGAYFISEHDLFRRILGQKYPYIFVDEAQDTFGSVVDALNTLCGEEGLPIVGYFGDPMQQIYDNRAGEFEGPPGAAVITKEENFRSAQRVIELLNAFRQDVKQVAAGNNADVVGEVFITLVRAEEPNGSRGRYTEEQTERALNRFDEALEGWGWAGRPDIKQLFLVRQMIARRLGFPSLHRLFTGQFASAQAQEDYEKGDHPLLRPFIEALFPIVDASSREDQRALFAVMRNASPSFLPGGESSGIPWREVLDRSVALAEDLRVRWERDSLGEILRFSREKGLCVITDRLAYHLDRARRDEEYDPDQHGPDKGEWLADAYFAMDTKEIPPYCNFVNENTPYSTQHGAKGEQYDNVLVVFDDTEAAWRNFSFT